MKSPKNGNENGNGNEMVTLCMSMFISHKNRSSITCMQASRLEHDILLAARIM